MNLNKELLDRVWELVNMLQETEVFVATHQGQVISTQKLEIRIVQGLINREVTKVGD